MYRVAFGILFIALTAVSGKVFINVLNEGSNTVDDLDGCYGNVFANVSTKMKTIQTDLKAINGRWEQELALQRKALQDIRSILLRQLRGNNTKTATSCEEALKENDQMSGVYQINLNYKGIAPFEVYCLKDPNNGPAWTVVQRRQDGSVDFYRGWYDYKHGFGDLEGEFWLGLIKLHALTTSQQHELWIQLDDFEGDKRYAKYDSFAIGDENAGFPMNILGKFTGDAGDSMKYQHGSLFSTKDVDNDGNSGGTCATQYTGAWWYNKCHDSNLNGRYLQGKNKPEENGKGIEWFKWHGHYSLKHVHMAIRPVIQT